MNNDLQLNDDFSAQNISEVLSVRHGRERQKKINKAVVGIAGLGGLGSHIAVMLARLGVGHLILVDFDLVDITNIHRQAYTLQDVNFPKHLALKQHLMQINPHLHYESHGLKLNSQNIAKIFQHCTIICEAFDLAQEKAMLTECVLTQMPNKFLVGASGMAGIANPNEIRAYRRFGNYFLCGDEVSDVQSMQGLYAPRVSLCASMQATVIMQLILGELDL